jgi:hypothetical protein
MYIYLPRQAATVNAIEPVSTEAAPLSSGAAGAAIPAGSSAGQPHGKKKRKRH